MTNTPQPPPKPSVHLNWQDWLPYLEDTGLNEGQKREMIETLWSIMMAFVDLGWDVTDTPQEISGQVLDLKAALTAAVLNSQEANEPESEEV